MKTDRGGFRMLQHQQLLHPLQRIMAVAELEYRYNKEDNLLRVAWRR